MFAFGLLVLALVALAMYGVTQGEPLLVLCPLGILAVIVFTCWAFSQQIGGFAALAAR